MRRRCLCNGREHDPGRRGCGRAAIARAHRGDGHEHQAHRFRDAFSRPVITREQIERSGSTSVDELLRQLPAISGGAAVDYDPGTGFQRGNSTASLRGLGSVATLVLLNGRRVAPAPAADPNVGQGTGFNLNSIPLSAIDRIEVLKDGASAVYGSEAIAGVINIILRKDYRGAEASVNHWQQSDGKYRADQVSAVVGYGDLAKDRFNVFIAGEW